MTILANTKPTRPGGVPTPYLRIDLDRVRYQLQALSAAIPGLAVFYAMKCNPARPILRSLATAGAGFEVASIGELRLLQSLDVEPAGLLYSNPVKPAGHIAQAHQAGLWRYSFDGPSEAVKIAEHAPGAAVYVRLRVDDSGSAVPLSSKFGAELQNAYNLMLLARRLGLRPYGVTFHVGSQCTSVQAWRAAIAAAGVLMQRLLGAGIELTMLDLGGGFPVRYVDDVPGIGRIGEVIGEAIDSLSYRPELIAAEPGRFLVADAGVLTTTVIGRERRDGRDWLYVDAGVHQGLGEALATPGWRYPIHAAVSSSAPTAPFVVTGPTCDSGDTVGHAIRLPATTGVGDLLHVGSSGGYSVAMSTGFNGFPPAEQVFAGDADATG